MKYFFLRKIWSCKTAKRLDAIRHFMPFPVKILLLCSSNNIFCDTYIKYLRHCLDRVRQLAAWGDVNTLYFLRKELISRKIHGLLIHGLKRQQTIFYLVFLSIIYWYVVSNLFFRWKKVSVSKITAFGLRRRDNYDFFNDKYFNKHYCILMM